MKNRLRSIFNFSRVLLDLYKMREQGPQSKDLAARGANNMAGYNLHHYFIWCINMFVYPSLVEGTGLENREVEFRREGSNPSANAIKKKAK